MTAPTQTAENGRDRAGRFAKGNAGGPGRPRGFDFRAVVAERVEATGGSIESALWDVFRSLLARAGEGDVQAARLLLDRLCGKDARDAEPPQNAAPMSEEARCARLSSILAGAARRAEEHTERAGTA